MTRKLAIAPLMPLPQGRAQKIAQAATGFEVVELNRNSEELANFEVIFGYPNPKSIRGSKSLKWLHSSTSGIDVFLGDEAALAPDVVITNSAGAYGLSIAEHLIAVSLMLLRQLGQYACAQTEGRWKNLGGTQSLYGKTVTVVGLGDIGGRYAALCKAFGATVRGIVRTPRSVLPNGVDTLYTAEDLDTALQDADIVAICLPSTTQTTYLFNKTRLNKLKPGSFLLNVGRGNIIDQDALIEVLQNGHLGGVGLDVTTPEPLPPDSPLWRFPNAIITPHISHGGGMDITQDLIVDKFISYLQDYIAGKPLPVTVDRNAGY